MQQTRVDVFEEIFIVFLALGTLVGVVVVAYTMYNAYKYRDVGDDEDDADRPVLGELPTGGQGGKKLFVSFGISAIIVISLIIWTYSMLLYVEDGPNPDDDAIEIDVEGDGFVWHFDYGEHEGESVTTANEMVIPADTTIWLTVTGGDVWHAFGITQERVKADAIPGEYHQTWFIAEEPGEYPNAIECYELCGEFHSDMDADLVVLEPDEFEEWLDEQVADDDEDEDDEEEEEENGDEADENEDTDDEGGDD